MLGSPSAIDQKQVGETNLVGGAVSLNHLALATEGVGERLGGRG